MSVSTVLKFKPASNLKLYLRSNKPDDDLRRAEDLPNLEENDIEIDLSGNQGEDDEEGYKAVHFDELFSSQEIKALEESQFTYFGKPKKKNF